MLSYLAGFVAVLLLPFYLSQVRGLDPREMGLMLTVTPLVMSILAPWAGGLSDRMGYGRLTAAGLAVRATAFAVLLSVGPKTPLPTVGLALGLLGAGSALFNPPNNSSIMGSVPPERLGVAGGVAAVARNLGMALGVATGGAVFSTGFRASGGGSLAAFDPSQIGAFFRGWGPAMTLGLLACATALGVSMLRSARVAPEADP